MIRLVNRRNHRPIMRSLITRAQAISLLMALLTVLSGCTSRQTKNILPDTAGVRQHSVDRTLSVAQVTGAQEERFGGPAMIFNAEFKDTLVAASQQAGIFRSVSASGGGELENVCRIRCPGPG